MIEVVNIKNYKSDDYIYVGRPSKWGNPYSSKDSELAERVENREESLKKYREYILNNLSLVDELIYEMNQNSITKLGCWCKPSNCHADILVELINEKKYKSIF